MKRGARWLALPIAGAAIAASPAARATVLIERSSEELVRASDAVVVGRAAGERAVSPDGRNIVTEVEFEVVRVVRGSAPAALTIYRLGGTIGDRGVSVAGTARLRVGAEYLLFVKRVGDRWAVTGMEQGAYRLQGGEAVREVSASLVRPGMRGLLPPGTGSRRLPLPELLDEIARVR